MTSKLENKMLFGVPDNSMVFARGVKKSFGAVEVLKGIDCVGTNDKKGTRICAATSVSFYQRDSWTIFLGSSFIKVFKF